MTKIYYSDMFGLHPQFLKMLQNPKGKMGVLLIERLLVPNHGWSLVAREASQVLQDGNFQPPTLGMGEARGNRGWVSQWSMTESVMVMWWSPHKNPWEENSGPFLHPASLSDLGNQNASTGHGARPQASRGQKLLWLGPCPVALFIWLLICILCGILY